MKFYSIFLIAFLGNFHFNSFSQQNNVFICFPEITMLYSGYDNLIAIQSANVKGDNLILECEGCKGVIQLLDDKNTNNRWIIKTDSVGVILLKVKNQQRKTLFEQKVQVVYPPYPNVFLDEIDAQSVLTKLPQKIDLKLDKSIPLWVQFSIYEWEISIDNKLFTGTGKNLSQELADYLILKQKGIIKIKIGYFSPFGKREIKEFFEFDLQ